MDLVLVLVLVLYLILILVLVLALALIWRYLLNLTERLQLGDRVRRRIHSGER